MSARGDHAADAGRVSIDHETEANAIPTSSDESAQVMLAKEIQRRTVGGTRDRRGLLELHRVEAHGLPDVAIRLNRHDFDPTLGEACGFATEEITHQRQAGERRA